VHQDRDLGPQLPQILRRPFRGDSRTSAGRDEEHVEIREVGALGVGKLLLPEVAQMRQF
jgi:hypothetical protein